MDQFHGLASVIVQVESKARKERSPLTSMRQSRAVKIRSGKFRIFSLFCHKPESDPGFGQVESKARKERSPLTSMRQSRAAVGIRSVKIPDLSSITGKKPESNSVFLILRI